MNGDLICAPCVLVPKNLYLFFAVRLSNLYSDPLQARSLALSLEFAHVNLIPLMTCASLVSRSVTVDGHRSARETPVVRGKLFVGQVSGGLDRYRGVDEPRSVDVVGCG